VASVFAARLYFRSFGESWSDRIFSRGEEACGSDSLLADANLMNGSSAPPPLTGDLFPVCKPLSRARQLPNCEPGFNIAPVRTADSGGIFKGNVTGVTTGLFAQIARREFRHSHSE